MRWRIENAIQYISNIYSYAKWSWTHNLDADYDWGILLDMISWKLDRMQKNFDKEGITEAARRNAKQMRYAIFLINRSQEGAMEYMEKEWYSKHGYGEIHKIFIDEKPKEEYIETLRRSYEVEEDAFKRLVKHVTKYGRQWWW